jgi:hypothetical protein
MSPYVGAEVSSVVHLLYASCIAAASALIVGGNAVFLDAAVRWLRSRGVSKSICFLLELTTMALAVMELALVITIAGAQAWEARPALLRMDTPSSQDARRQPAGRTPVALTGPVRPFSPSRRAFTTYLI